MGDRLVQQRQRRRRDHAAGEQPAAADALRDRRRLLLDPPQRDFDKSKSSPQAPATIVRDGQPAVATELDGQYRVLREGAGVARARRPQAARGRRRRGGRVPAGPADQRRRGARARATAATRRCSTARATCRATCASCARADGFLIDTEEIAGEAVLRHLGDVQGRSRRRRSRTSATRGPSISVIGPAAAELALGGPARPRARPPPGERRRRRRASPSRPTLGVDLLVARGRRDAVLEALAERGAEPVERGRRRDRPGRGRQAALRARDDHRDDPPGGRDQRARGQLRQGLLHRPGDRRPPALQGQAQPPPARPAPGAGPAANGDPVRLGERELGTIGTAVLSPAHGPIALAILRREAEPGATVEVGDGDSRRGRRAARSELGPGGDPRPARRRRVRLGLRARWACRGG